MGAGAIEWLGRYGPDGTPPPNEKPAEEMVLPPTAAVERGATLWNALPRSVRTTTTGSGPCPTEAGGS
jgi:hypothetical protein